jgi:hypothetical protein
MSCLPTERYKASALAGDDWLSSTPTRGGNETGRWGGGPLKIPCYVIVKVIVQHRMAAAERALSVRRRIV